MKLTTNKHKFTIIISIIFINAFAHAQVLICDTIQIWPDVKIISCREQHFLKFKNIDGNGGCFWTLFDTINKANIVIKRSTWNLIPPKNAKDIITNKIDTFDTTIIFGTYLNTNTSTINNFKQKIYPSFEISYWDVTDSLKATYDSIINSILIFQTDTIRYDSSGDTTYVQRNASGTHYRTHYGSYVKETGQPDKIYNEEGYIALHGDSVSYHFFERDYLGSVRAVFDLYGNLEQTNDYNVTGIPSSRHTGNADVHKHTGKEYQGFNGLSWYDNNARYYDPILARFTTSDPLAERYPWLSPYNHCANNPLRFVDPDGLRPTEKEAARMADYVYGNGNVSLIGGWIKSENNYGISINHNESGFKSMLFERTVDGVTEYTYAFAGTDLTSIKDWGNNIVQLIGMSKQYSIAMNNAQRLTDELDSKELTFVGHSLGGGLAAASAYATDGTAMTFNAAGVSPFTIAKSSGAKIDAYVTINDELHNFQSRMRLPTADGTKHWRIGISNLLGHSIENFYKPNIFKQVKNWLFEKF